MQDREMRILSGMQTDWFLYEYASENDVEAVRFMCRKKPGLINLPYKHIASEISYLLSATVCGASAVVTGATSGGLAYHIWSGAYKAVKNLEDELDVALALSAVSLLSGIMSLASTAFSIGFILDRAEEHDKRMHDGWTFLEFAAARGATDVMIELLAHGADVSNKRFLEIAKQHGHLAFIKTFRRIVKSARDKAELQSECARLSEKYLQSEADLEKEIVAHNETHDQHERLKYAMKHLDETPVPAAPSPASPKIASAVSATTPIKVVTPASLFKYGHEYPFSLSEEKILFEPGDCFLNAFMAADPENRIGSVEEGRLAVQKELVANRAKYEGFFGWLDEDGMDEDALLRQRYPLCQSMPGGECIETVATKYEDICEHVVKPQAWMDNVQMAAFCNAYKVCVITIDRETFNGTFNKLGQSMKSMIQAIVAATSDKVFGRQYAKPETYDNPPIILGYINQEHYVPLVFRGKKELRSAWDRSIVLRSIESHKEDFDKAYKAAADAVVKTPKP